MRRLMVVAAVIVLACLAAAQLRHPQRSQAISYPAGWNLISGPDGSRARGATELLTFQPGDTDYETFSADTPLRGGYGYWAYFPNGGSIDLAPGTARYTVTLIPGQYAQVGNPSALYSATVQGADDLETYDPVAGVYNSASEIPAGQGAWVSGQGAIVITGIGPSEPITIAGTPSPTPAPLRTATPTAAVPPSNPNFTAQCNDATYDYVPFSGATCAAHGGIKALGPAATQTAPNSVNLYSQPQARCNDGATDYSTLPTPCAADGGVAYYIALPSQRVPSTATPTTTVVPFPQFLTVGEQLAPPTCAGPSLVVTASVSASGIGPVIGGYVTAIVTYTSSAGQSTSYVALAPTGAAGVYTTTLGIGNLASGTGIDVALTAELPSQSAYGAADSSCTRP